MKLNTTMRYWTMAATLTQMARQKYPMPFDVMPRSGAANSVTRLYSSIARQFWITHKIKWYRGRVAKCTLREFENWKPTQPIQ